MAKRVRDADLVSRASRAKLPVAGKPVYKAIGEGLHLGYRKNAVGGKWVVRRYIGDQQYQVQVIGIADDIEDANGDTVLDFWQAQERARGKRLYRGPYKVADAVADYLKSLEGRGTHYERSNRAGHFVLPDLGEILVDEISAATIRSWHAKLSTMAPLIPKTKGSKRRAIDLNDPDQARRRKVSANRCLGILKAALNLAFREGHAASDAEWRRVAAFKKVERSRTRYLSFAEVERLLNACALDFRVLVRGALETGMRYGELTRLKVADYNIDAGVIRVAFSKDGNERHVILSDDGQKFFAELVAGRAGGDLMFGRKWNTSQQVRRMRLVCKRAGIEPHVGFHQLRHTWASHAVMAGMPLAVVAKNLGHVDTRMVEMHYGHLAPSYVSEQVRKFAPRFGNVRAL
jgi:integrase